MKALILVDIQNDFLPGGALPVPHGDEVVPIANILIPRFKLVIATQDWHPADHGSFASRHPGHQIGDIIELNGLSQILWPDHCVQGTPGAEFASGLNVAGIHRVFQKGTDAGIDSYSGLYDNGHRKSTGLAEFLRAGGVTDLYVMGLATDYCVKFTALDARAEGFNVHLIEDGCRGVDLKPGDVRRAIDEMKSAGVQLIHTSSLTSTDETRILWEGKYLDMVARGKWEFVRRKGASGVVGILAVTDNGRLLMVEQLRPPIGRPTIELPAGLAGDIPGAHDESLAIAAQRELLEETGYEAAEIIPLSDGVSSAGLTDETITLMLARGLKKSGPGGGEPSEKITVHEIPVGEVHEFLRAQSLQGKAIDFKIYAGLYLLQLNPA